MTRGRLSAAASLLALCLAPVSAAPARAETLLTAFGGVSFGGATDRTRGTYGGAIGFLGDGPLGFEAEFATTPEFFGEERDDDFFTDNNVLTMMGSFLLATPRSDVRFYAAFGAGLMKTRLEDAGNLLSVDSNDFGINVGGGLIGSLSENLALRVDVRYFRDLQDPDPDDGFDVDFGNVDYWRAVGGITLKF
jgi:opacity protein-like surface antigen